MLKKTLISVLAVFAVATQAAPVYLTFEGNVATSYSSATVTGPEVGELATLVLLADLDAAGYYTFAGTTVDLGGSGAPGYYNYFLVDYVSGPVFTGGTGNPYAYGGSPYDYHYGVNYSNIYNEGFELVVSPTDQSSAYSYLYLSNYTSGATAFQIGQVYSGNGYAYDLSSNDAGWSGSFTLTGMSDVAPGTVPEPGGLALLGLGLLGVVGVARKRLRRKA